MQKTIWSILLCALIFSLVPGCENELNIAADYEETAVIYGAIDPTSTKNYIRIQRAYLDEKQAAVTFSNIQDSLYYDTLNVTLDEFENGVFKRQFVLSKVNGNDIGLPKDTGLFYSDDNILYELDADLKQSTIDVDVSYGLTVVNPETNYTVRGATISLGSPTLRRPVSEFIPNFAIPNTAQSTIRAIYQEGVYAFKYSMEMIARVQEVNKADTSQKIVKEIRWPMFTGVRTRSEKSRIEAVQEVSSLGFYSAMSGALDEDPTITRHLLGFDIYLYGITEDFSTFLDVNRPSIGIVQKKPEFSNIENGLGIFTCRHITRFEDLKFQPTIINGLQNSELTENLGFLP